MKISELKVLSVGRDSYVPKGQREGDMVARCMDGGAVPVSMFVNVHLSGDDAAKHGGKIAGKIIEVEISGDGRLFDTSQNGIEYVSKCLDPKNRYEFNKFGLARTLTFSPAFVRVIRAQERRNGAFCNAGKEKAVDGRRGIPGANI